MTQFGESTAGAEGFRASRHPSEEGQWMHHTDSVRRKATIVSGCGALALEVVA